VGADTRATIAVLSDRSAAGATISGIAPTTATTGSDDVVATSGDTHCTAPTA
jgi:hypothetical protein